MADTAFAVHRLHAFSWWAAAGPLALNAVLANGEVCVKSPDTTRNVEIVILKDWDHHKLSYHPEKDKPVVVVAKPHHKEEGRFSNMAGAWYRHCPEKAKGSAQTNWATCPDKLVALVGDGSGGGYCEATSASVKFNDGSVLDNGEAGQIGTAFEENTKDHLKTPPQGKPMLAHDANWLDYLHLMSVKRHDVDRADHFKTMVYPVPLDIYLSKLLTDKPAHWYLGCKAALDPAVFDHAELMQYLNNTLHLWVHGCPDTKVKADGGRNAGMIMAIIISVVGMALALFGFLLYRHLANQPEKSRSDNARQVEMSNRFV